MTLAVVILAYNEERNIVEAIENAKSMSDEIIVIDAGSQDKTVELAKKHGAQVVFRAWDDDFAAQRNFAEQNTQADFLFHLDADERVTPRLAVSVRQAVTENKQKIFALRRVNSAFGRPFRHGFMRPNKVKRLYPRGKAHWQGKVHESLAGSIGEAWLAGDMMHHTYYSWEQYLGKLNQYTTLAAQEKFAQGKRTSVLKAFFHAVFGFVKMFIFKRGFLDGVWGLVMCLMHFMYVLMKYLKLLLLQEENRR